MKTGLVSITALLSLTMLPVAAWAHGDEVHTEHAAAPAAKPADATAAKPGEATAAIAGHVATLVASDDGLTLTLREKSGQLPESATDAKVTMQIGKEKREVALAGDKGDFTGKTDLKGVTHFVAVLSVKIDGKVKTVRLKVDRVK